MNKSTLVNRNNHNNHIKNVIKMAKYYSDDTCIKSIYITKQEKFENYNILVLKVLWVGVVWETDFIILYQILSHESFLLV